MTSSWNKEYAQPLFNICVSGDVILYVPILLPSDTLAFPVPESYGTVDLDVCSWATPFSPC